MWVVDVLLFGLVVLMVDAATLLPLAMVLGMASWGEKHRRKGG
jgi:hypothetical protein